MAFFCCLAVEEICVRDIQFHPLATVNLCFNSCQCSAFVSWLFLHSLTPMKMYLPMGTFSLYFVLAQEPQTTVIHNPDGNKVFRKNQLHLAFPHHTFHPLFHSTIGPFQEFVKENLIPAFVTPGVSRACFHPCPSAACILLLLSSWSSWGSR